ncbi:MAG: ATP-binding protein [Planctomycetaceae bacterium]
MSDSTVVLEGLTSKSASELALLRTRIGFAVEQYVERTGEANLRVRVSGKAQEKPSAVGGASASPADIPRDPEFQAVSPKFSMERVCLPQKVRELMLSSVSALQHERLIFEEWGLSEIQAVPRCALLLHGPPGTGKTAAAHAIASWLSRPIVTATTGELESKYLGDGPKRVAAFFECARRQDAVAFIDEADTLLGRRMSVSQGSERAANSMTSQLLIEIEQFRGVVVFATNMKKNIDEAFMTRVLSLEIPLPDAEQRRLIWERHLPSRLPVSHVDIDQLATIEGVCGRDVRNAVMLAATRAASSRCRSPITQEDLLQALNAVRTSPEPAMEATAIPESVQKKLRESAVHHPAAAGSCS